ncbi:MAG TPA: biotin/lipoyl-containing protein, partial [Stellaceae bacterium]|nr:biotin/lipoyl-containing protein [Stellaceae bacterium]
SYAPTRRAAAAQLARACRAVQVWPVKTNARLLARCLQDPAFLDGQVDTDFIPARLSALTQKEPPSPAILKAAALGRLRRDGPDVAQPWRALTGFRLNAPSERQVRLRYEAETYTVALDEPVVGPNLPTVRIDGTIIVFDAGEAYPFVDPTLADASESANHDGAILAPMPGRVVQLSIAKDDRVAKGQALLTLEAMKTEHTLTAPFDGLIAELPIQLNAQVTEGVLLVRLRRIDEP